MATITADTRKRDLHMYEINVFFCFSDVFNCGIWADTKSWTDDIDLQRNLERLKSTVLMSRAAGTTDCYRRAFSRWKSFTMSHDKMKALPATPIDVALYLQSLIDSSGSASTVETAFYAINWAHWLAGVDSPTKHPLVVAVRDSALRTLGKHKEHRKMPITAEHIKVLIEASNLNNLLILRNTCIFVIAFAGFFRIEEVLNLKRNHIEFINEGIIISVESSKTDQLRMGDKVIIATIPGSNSCPVSILNKYLSSAGLLNMSGEYLFRPLSKTVSGHKLVCQNKPISYTTIREAFKSSFKNIVSDINQYSTHSLRAGGATAAANAGVGDRVFQRHGRWKSTSAKDGYVLDDIRARAEVSKKLGL